MAKPQMEDGYITIVNSIFDHILKTDFTERELKIVLFIIRYTYGFNRKSHKMSLSFIAKGIGIQRSHVALVLNKLIEGNVVIEVVQNSKNSARVLELNKNYDEWKTGARCYQKSNSVQKSNSYQKSSTGCYQKDNTSVTKKVTQGCYQKSNQDNTIYKTNIKNKIKENQKNSFSSLPETLVNRTF